MRKKSVFVLLMLLALSSISLIFAGCDYTTGEIGRIDYSPYYKKIFWEKVAGADNYTVYENGKRLLNTNDTKFPVSALKEEVSYITVLPQKGNSEKELSEEYLFVTKGSEGIIYILLEDRSGYKAVFNETVPEGTVINVQSVYENLPVTGVSILDCKAVVPDTIKEINAIGSFQYENFRIPLSLENFGLSPIFSQSYSASKFHNFFTIKDGITYSKDMTKLVRYPTLKKDNEYIMPNSIKEILGGAIINDYITTIELSINLEKINSLGFGLKRVEKLRIPSKTNFEPLSVAFIGKLLILENGIIEIPSNAITITGNNNCEVYLPKSIKNIAINGIANEKQVAGLKVTLHCAANEKPAGWHENWQKGCEVIWGEKF